MGKIDFIIKDKEKYSFSLDVKKVKIYPEVKSLEVTPSKELQIHKPNNCYGYSEVKVNPIPDEYIITEDLTEELSTYNSELSLQESLINSIIETLNSRK